MDAAQTVMDRVKELPEEEQQTVLSFVEFLVARRQKKTPTRSIKGALAGLGVTLSAEDIDRARAETWQRLGSRDRS